MGLAITSFLSLAADANGVLKVARGMNESSDYSEAWKDYRARRFVFLAVSLSYLPSVVLISLLLSSLTGIKSDYFPVALAGAWMLAFLVTSVRMNIFPCPRCGKRFFTTRWIHNPFARHCLHCTLPKWAMSD